MTFVIFAGRTLRRLHQTVQRNISRRHESTSSSSKSSGKQQQQQSKPSGSSEPKPFSGTYSAWMDPIKIPFRAYSNMQSRSPYLTQFETSLVIYFLGDLSAQTVQTSLFSTGQYEPIRGIRAMIIGGISSIPSYTWFLWLGRHFNYPSHLKSLGVKIFVNQMCFTPVFNTYFFGMQTLLAGGSVREAWERCKRTVPRSFVNSWKVWPVITAFSFTFIAPHSRSAFAGMFAVIWQTYLSWLNRAAEEAAEREKGFKGVQADSRFEREAKEVVKMEAKKVAKVVKGKQ
ncbi:related to glomerulosclerosis protein Mpv17 [Ramularia collo-cygni]|uniref:Related to glomerulosclerosis protein Mpv17 n=1 Tax=Ramularia collo-cygni TaxID=112498 RepID=A0A2D3UMK7_9PEZI|nr:related to glomerulosclerosis protein Mpv17 [Ramularia collo-cygni]CZT14038.1 related to glomerulosclerosis protein Mpv17 [Ramularia collo-cygni]